MSRLWKLLIMLISTIFVINIIYSCVVDMFDLDGFESKEEVIIAIEENTSDLNKLTQEMYYKFQNDSKRATIENSFLRTSNKSFIYKTILSNKVFKNMKIRCVYINYDTKNIKFSVKCKFGTYCGFYYSFDNNKNYEIITESIKQDKLTSYFELGNEAALLWQMKSGWYTENIYNNWYYYEDDWDYLNLIKYIYDDIVNISTLSEYHQKYKNSFERYNPHKQEVYEE